jgi:hypothetical protein
VSENREEQDSRPLIHVEGMCGSRAFAFFLRSPTNLADRHPMEANFRGNFFVRLSLLPKLLDLGERGRRDAANLGFPCVLYACEYRQQFLPKEQQCFVQLLPGASRVRWQQLILAVGLFSVRQVHGSQFCGILDVHVPDVRGTCLAKVLERQFVEGGESLNYTLHHVVPMILDGLILISLFCSWC